MANITVFFEPDKGADLHQIAALVQEKTAALPNVTAASAQPVVTRGFDPSQIMMTATAVMGTATAGIVALTALIQALEKLGDEIPALGKVMVQVGLKKVPADQLTEHDIKKLAGA